MIDTNVRGTANLIEAGARVGFEALVNAGSSSEYGFKDHPPGEDELLEPNSYYAVTKSAASLLCQYVSQSEQLPLITLRLYSVYGPWEEPTRLVPSLILNGLVGAYPPLARPDVARDFVYVEDVNDAFILAASHATERPGTIFNVGTGIQTSLRDAVEISRRLFGIDHEPRWESMPNRAWDATTWIAQSQRIREILGWQPRYSFEKGLAEFAAWLRAAPGLLQLYREKSD
jgi:dolichol-phosphate mannosyltransferase